MQITSSACFTAELLQLVAELASQQSMYSACLLHERLATANSSAGLMPEFLKLIAVLASQQGWYR